MFCKRVYFFICFSLFLCQTVSGLEGIPHIESSIDWAGEKLIIDISRKVDYSGGSSPDLRYQLEKDIHQELYLIFYRALQDLKVDSYYTVKDLLENSRTLNKRISEMVPFCRREYSHLTGQMDEIHVRYSSALFGDSGVFSGFVDHLHPVKIPVKLSYTSSRAYTGIIIYVKGEFPLYRKNEMAPLTPVFFPDIYDEEMNHIYGKTMCPPETLKKWGMTAYTTLMDEKKFTQRIGVYPLKTMALKLFGRHNSDIILPRDVVDKIISLEANRNLLREGRVLIIYGDE